MLKRNHFFGVLLLTVALAHTLALAQEKSSIDVDPFGARSSSAFTAAQCVGHQCLPAKCAVLHR